MKNQKSKKLKIYLPKFLHPFAVPSLLCTNLTMKRKLEKNRDMGALGMESLYEVVVKLTFLL